MNLKQSINYSRAKGVVPIIAEIKRIIPKLAEEIGRDKRDAAFLAGCYEQGGAAGISLVTEERYFGGQPEIDIPAVLRSTSLPLLIKDFVLDQERINFFMHLIQRVDRACLERVSLLLIAHMVGEDLPALLQHVHDCGMMALVETRYPGDLQYLGKQEPLPQLFGINNKNIDELEIGDDVIRVNPGMIDNYRKEVGDAIIISQSAHRTPADVRCSLTAGADAVLVGTAIMLADDPRSAVTSFIREEEELN